LSFFFDHDREHEQGSVPGADSEAMSSKKLIGQQAPALTLPNYDGETFTMTPGEGGLPIALFFYPKAGSYGCTKEACQFRDAIAGT
jgi:thioredoxin-dependent peroxiredoxin